MREYNKQPGPAAYKAALAHKRYFADVEASRARSRAYAAKDSEKRKRYFAAYYRRHATEMKSAVLRYRQTAKGRAVAAAARRRHRAVRAGSPAESVSAQHVFAAWGNRCAYCGGDDRLQIDHFVPLARGGAHRVENLVAACIHCNSGKSAKDPWVYLHDR